MEEKVVTETSSAEDVNSPVVESVVESKENIEDTKAQEVENNKTIALKAEREKRREMESKLAEYESAEAKREEKEKLKKWRYEEVLAEKEAKLAEYESKLNETQSYKEKWTTYMDTQVNDLLNKIPDGKKEFVNEVIDWKDFDAKVRLLKWFSDEYKAYNPQPSNNKWQQSVWQQTPSTAKDALSQIAGTIFN